MKQVILNIPDSEFDFFMKLIQKFNYKTADLLESNISEEDKQLVDDRRKTAKPSDYMTRSQSNGNLVQIHAIINSSKNPTLIG